MNPGTDFLRFLLLMGKIGFVAAVLIVLYFVWNFMFGMKTAEFARTALTSSAESDLVVTSFAQVDLLYLEDGNREIMVPSDAAADSDAVSSKFKEADRFCLHSYEVVFGYPSLAGERARQPAPGAPPVSEPAIVATNVLRTENAPDDATTWCQKKNLKERRAALRRELTYALLHDDVLHTHLTHGQLTLAATLDLAEPRCRGVAEQADRSQCLVERLKAHWAESPAAIETELPALETELTGVRNDIEETRAALVQLTTDPSEHQTALRRLEDRRADLEFRQLFGRRAMSAHAEAARVGTDVASLVLTFSVTLGVSQERKRFLGLWTSKRFYLERDVAKVYYGTHLSPTAVRSEWRPFGPDRIVLEFPEPSILAIDRYASFVVARKKIEKVASARQSLANYLNQEMLANLEAGIARFHARAVKTAESILVERVPGYFGLDNVEYDIHFQRFGRVEPDLTFLPGVLNLEPVELD